jgi:hypothetical protein
MKEEFGVLKPSPRFLSGPGRHFCLGRHLCWFVHQDQGLFCLLEGSRVSGGYRARFQRRSPGDTALGEVGYIYMFCFFIYVYTYLCV